jgi:hypothetical protein
MTSVGADLTGLHPNAVILDDPINEKNYDSEIELAAIESGARRLTDRNAKPAISGFAASAGLRRSSSRKPPHRTSGRGSSIADASAIGSLLLPSMIQAGYTPPRASAIVAAATGMGVRTKDVSPSPKLAPFVL